MTQQPAILARIATLTAREIAALPVAEKIAAGRALAVLAADQRAEWIREMTRVSDPAAPGYYRHDGSRLSALDYTVGEPSPPRSETAGRAQPPPPIQIRVKLPSGEIFTPTPTGADGEALIVGTCEFALDLGDYHRYSPDVIAEIIHSPPHVRFTRAGQSFEITRAAVLPNEQKFMLRAEPARP